MRICIVTPGQIGSNPRVVKEADAFVDAGHSVHVVATKVAGFVEPRDQAIMARARFAIERIAFDNRILWLRERLRQASARVLFAAVPSPALASSACSAFARRLRLATEAVRADLYVAHYTAALPAAASAARKFHAAYAFDAEDFHLGDLPDTVEFSLEKRMIRDIEATYLPGAAYTTAASPMIADAYTNAYGLRRPTVVLNTFPRRNAPPYVTPRGTARPSPSLYWFSQTIGAGRGLETAVEALARATSQPHLYLRGTPAPGYAELLRSLAQRYGVADRLHILAPEVPDEMERSGAQYDVGYVGELAETENRQIALTNKLFSYVLSGVPVVASDIPAHRALAPEFGNAMTLFPAGDAYGLAVVLDRWFVDPMRLSAARAHIWNLGQERFNWEIEARVLIKLVEQLYGRPIVNV